MCVQLTRRPERQLQCVCVSRGAQAWAKLEISLRLKDQVLSIFAQACQGMHVSIVRKKQFLKRRRALKLRTGPFKHPGDAKRMDGFHQTFDRGMLFGTWWGSQRK